MKFWLLVIAIASAAPVPRIEDSSRPYWYQNLIKNSAENVLSGPTSNWSFFGHWLFKRGADPDNLKAPVERLQKIARITNGIYLLQDLIAGKIPSEELISELLFFGSVKPSEVAQMDSAKIQGALNTLKDLPTSLDVTPEISKVEKAFNGLNDILKEIDGIGNIADWDADITNFKNEINRLSSPGVTMTVISVLGASALNWEVAYPILTSNDASVDKATFVEVKSALEKIKKVIPTFDTAKPTWEFNQFGTAVAGISSFSKAASGVNVFLAKGQDTIINDNDATSYVTYLETKSASLKPVNDVRLSLVAIQKLLTSFGIKSRQRNLKYTFGLPQGSSDVSSMLVDVSDSWVKTVVQSDALKTGFKKFDDFESLLKGVETSLDTRNLAELDKTLEHIDSLGIDLNIDDAKVGVPQGNKCDLPISVSLDSTNFDELKNILKNIDAKLDKLQSGVKGLTVHIKTPGLTEMCSEVIAICEKAATASDLKQVIDEFNKYSKLAQLNTLFVNIKNDVTDIQSKKPETIKSDAIDAISKMGSLDNYHTQLKRYAKFFTCLQDETHLKLVLKIVEGLQKIRAFKTDPSYSNSIQNGLAVVNKVIGNKNNLDNLKKWIEGMKGFSSKETDGLKLLTDGSKHSMNIGLSVQGVSNMQYAGSQKSLVDKVLNNLQVVKDNQKTLVDPGDIQNLNDLIALEPVIQNMYQLLDNFNAGAKDSESTDLKSHAAIFQQAASVSGVKSNFLEIADTLEKLKGKLAVPGDEPKLDAIITSLKTMDSMGLDFASYKTSFNEAGESLDAMNTFFASFKKQMDVVNKAPQGQKRQKNPSIAQQGALGYPEKNKNFSQWPMFLVYAFCGLVVFVIIVANLISLFVCRLKLCKFYKRCMFWKKKKHEEEIDYDSYEEALRRFVEKVEGDIMTLKKILKFEDQTDWFMFYGHFYSLFLTDTSITRWPENPDVVELVMTDCRFDTRILTSRIVILEGYGKRFPNNFFHAAKFRITATNHNILIVEGPQKASKGKNSTIGKTWWMAKQQKTKKIIMLCPLVEGGWTNCDLYFPLTANESVTFDDLKLTCKSVTPMFGDLLEIRSIVAKFGKEKPFEVTHYWLKGWQKDVYPEGELLNALIHVWKDIERENDPPMIHSSDGNFRAAHFASVAYLSQDYLDRNRTAFRCALTAVRDCRQESIQHVESYFFFFNAVFQYFSQGTTTTDEDLLSKIAFLKSGYENRYQGNVNQGGQAAKK